MYGSGSAQMSVVRDEGRTEVDVLVLHEEEIVHYGWRLLLSRCDWASRCLAARDRAEALMLLDRYEPTVAILDLDAGHQQVADTVAAMLAVAPKLPVLLVSGTSAISPKAARYIGAAGVIRRSVPAGELAGAVRAVASGQRLFAVSTPLGAGRLSDREAEVLSLMSSGATNREIASTLHVSTETIKRHAATIFRKLSVRNRTEAAQRGHELGLAARALVA